MIDVIVPSYLLSKTGVPVDGVCYAMKISNITRRKSADTNNGGFGGLVSGFAGAINNTVSSALGDFYFVRTTENRVWVLSDKTNPVSYACDDFEKNIDILPEKINLTLGFRFGDVESATFHLDKESINKNFYGDVKAFLSDMGGVNLENVTNHFVNAVISKRTGDGCPYKFQKTSSASTLLSYNSSGVTLLNEHKRYNFDKMLAVHSERGYLQFVVEENSEFTLVEIFDDVNYKISEPEFNLVRDNVPSDDGSFEIFLNENILTAESFMAAFSVKNLKLLAVNDKIYFLSGNGISECGIFKVNNEIIVKTISGVCEAFEDCNGITETLSMLPSGFDGIFLDTSVPQPFVYMGEITEFTVNDKMIKSENAVFEYVKMQECKFDSDDFGCRINFVYDGNKVGMTTANSLGIYVCNLQEKVKVEKELDSYNINQLYECFYRRSAKNFLAGTFAEIFKTEKLLNVDSSLDEFILMLKSDSSEVLRNALSSMISKFKNVDDLQSDLLQKVSLLEIQRRKIQKMFDEWFLYYPHYAATIQANWLKYLFGDVLDSKLLDSEYWKCVNHYKRILSSGNGYVQKNMAEIGICVNRINAALPESVKRADITDELRINYKPSKNIIGGGAELLVGITAGVELANILVRGLSITSPLTLSLSAKMAVDSYTKDVNLRKNVKAFGLQSLEWWKIFMNGVRIHILEISHSVNEYNVQCLKRDTELFKKLDDSKKTTVKEKLSKALKEKISTSIDEKYIEILSQFNMRISDVINEIDSNTDFLNMTFDEFENKLFV